MSDKKYILKNSTDLQIMGLDLCDYRVNELHLSKRVIENNFNLNSRSLNLIEDGSSNKGMQTFLRYCKILGYEVTIELKKIKEEDK